MNVLSQDKCSRFGFSHARYCICGGVGQQILIGFFPQLWTWYTSCIEIYYQSNGSQLRPLPITCTPCPSFTLLSIIHLSKVCRRRITAKHNVRSPQTHTYPCSSKDGVDRLGRRFRRADWGDDNIAQRRAILSTWRTVLVE